jgi:hypothetical protein
LTLTEIILVASLDTNFKLTIAKKTFYDIKFGSGEKVSFAVLKDH